MRRVLAIGAAALLLAGGGCASEEPERKRGPEVGHVSYVQSRERLRARDEAAERAKEGWEAIERRRLGIQESSGNSSRLKRELLDAYGVRLTPFQRSALLSSSIATREEGEAMCRKWIEENERFERGR